MKIDNAAAVLDEAAQSLTAYKEGKLFEHNLMLKPCFEQFKAALDQAWNEGLTSPKYQRMPDWVPLESHMKIALCTLKSLEYQISSGKFELYQINSPGNLESLDVTTKIFETISANVSEYGHKDYPDLSTEQLMQLSDDMKAVINLLKATYALLE